jgi:hypothetical protein
MTVLQYGPFRGFMTATQELSKQPPEILSMLKAVGFSEPRSGTAKPDNLFEP